MSFAQLKKNKGSAFSKLQKQLEETNKFAGSRDDERLWKLTTDKAGNGFAIIRFLPAIEGKDEMPFVKLYSHGFRGPTGGWYIENSLTTLGQQDPLGKYNQRLWNSGDDALKQQARNQKRKLSYYSNIYVVKDPANPENEGKVFIFRYGKKIFDKIMDATNGNELEGTAGINPFCFWTGADFKLRSKKVAGYPNYDDSAFDAPGTIGGFDGKAGEAQIESVYKQQHELHPLVAPDQFKSYEALQERLNSVLDLAGSQTTEKVVETLDSKPDFNQVENMNLKPAPVDVTQGVDTDEQPEDDTMDYFRKMAEGSN